MGIGSITDSQASVFARCGYFAPVTWCSHDEAAALARQLTARPGLGNVTANPHLTDDWARRAVTCGPVIGCVRALIGADIAVENTFLMTKRPSDGFTVPAHQDGINDRIQLDPARSVAVWLAISEASLVNGGLEIVPGSHQGGYLPYRRAGSSVGSSQRPLSLAAGRGGFTPVRLDPGQACALDVRLVHRSGPNTASARRIGLNVRYVAPGGWIVRDGPGPHLLPVTGNRW